MTRQDARVSPARVGWGIQGTGHMAATMAAVLATRPDAAVVAVASRYPDRAAAFAQARDIPHACAGLDALLRRPEVDICYIASPPDRHLPDCLAALAAGRHVLCEKPLAMTAAEARRIADSAAAAGRFCMEALWTQFLPAMAAAARLLDQGAVGARLHVAASFGLHTPAADAACRAGALLDRGCYPISLALRLFGPVAGVAGSVTRRADGVDTDAVILIDFADGNTAALAASLTGYLGNNVVISGTTGRLTLREPITSPALLTVASAGAGSGGSAPSIRTRLGRLLPVLPALARLRHTRVLRFSGNGYAHQIDAVHRCLAAGQLQSDIMPLSLSIATLEVIDSLNHACP